jgi:hypothetical protein
MAGRWKNIEDDIDKAREARRHGVKERGERSRDDRLTWRERDRKKDSSGHTEQSDRDRPSGEKGMAKWAEEQAQKAAKGQLEELFRDTKGDSLRSDILQAEDRVALQNAMEAWTEARGALPVDPELLEKCLDSRKDKTLREVVEVIATALPNLDTSAQKILLRKMQLKGRRSFDAPLSKRINELLSEYGIDD